MKRGVNMNKTFFLKYKENRILLRYCNYGINYYAINKRTCIIIYININYSKEMKSKILHKAIKNSKKGKFMLKNKA